MKLIVKEIFILPLICSYSATVNEIKKLAKKKNEIIFVLFDSISK